MVYSIIYYIYRYIHRPLEVKSHQRVEALNSHPHFVRLVVEVVKRCWRGLIQFIVDLSSLIAFYCCICCPNSRATSHTENTMYDVRCTRKKYDRLDKWNWKIQISYMNHTHFISLSVLKLIYIYFRRRILSGRENKSATHSTKCRRYICIWIWNYERYVLRSGAIGAELICRRAAGFNQAPSPGPTPSSVWEFENRKPNNRITEYSRNWNWNWNEPTRRYDLNRTEPIDHLLRSFFFWWRSHEHVTVRIQPLNWIWS